jgi:hypothetical protein
MPKYLLIFSITCIYCASCFAQKDADLLKRAYQTGNTHNLHQFCTRWQKEYPAITNKEFANLNDTIKEAYLLFSDFFERYLFKEREQEWKTMKRDSSFVIIQNDLKVSVTDHQIYYSQHQIDSFIFTQFNAGLADSVNRDFESSDLAMDSFIITKAPGGKRNNLSLERNMFPFRDNYSPYRAPEYWKEGRLVADITDFRPQLNPAIRWLSWNTSKYEVIMHLKDKATKKQRNNPANAYNVLKFLNQKIPFIPAQLSRETPPKVFYSYPRTDNEISSITFDEKLEYALVTFSTPSMTQKDIWHKENGHWQFVSCISMAISQE